MNPPDDFDKVAREIIEYWQDTHSLIAPKDIKHDMLIDISQALRESFERGLKQAEKTNEEIQKSLLRRIELLEKPVEVRMPERKKHVEKGKYILEQERYFNGETNGWNSHDDAVRALNPELFEGKEIK
jgi:hypothetical protein